MEKIKSILPILFLLIIIHGCSKEKEIPDGEVLVGDSYYHGYPDSPVTISDVAITGDILKVTIAASGCSGGTWKVNLVGSGSLMYSLPPKRMMRISLQNDELCTAYVGRVINFDLKPARIEGNQIVLLIDGWDDPVVYSY
ncbi:MAG: hypothetical protein U0X39_11785 [Bacteroidales bacterium]